MGPGLHALAPTALLAFLCGCAADRRPDRSPLGPARAARPHAARETRSRPTPSAQARPGPWTVARTLQHASHETGDAPTVVVHAPETFRPSKPLQLVVFLHGWDCCATSIMDDEPCRADEAPRGWSVAALHDEAGADSLLVVPQLAYLRRSSDPGRFAEPRFFRGFVEELLGEALRDELGGPRSIREIGTVTLVAHSAGYRTAMAIVDKGGLAVDHVVLLDALYRGVAVFVRWLTGAPGRKLVSLHSDVRFTTQHNRVLAFDLVRRLGRARVSIDPPGGLREAIRTHVAVVKRTPFGHAGVIEHRLADVLVGLGLRR